MSSYRGSGSVGLLVRLGSTAVAVVVLAAGLAGCSGSASGSDSSGKIAVLASTDVWGNLAKAVGGRWVAVTSVISNPDQDPHSYEASSRTLLDIKDADLLIENGGGYDDFMNQMITSVGTHAPVLDAVAISGRSAPPGGDLNEHVWYDFPTVEKVANAVAAKLGTLSAEHAAAFEATARAIDVKVDALIAAEHRMRQLHAGTGVSITEPVPVYLLDAMGLHNLTPPAFSRAVEEGNDVAARVLAQTLALYSNHQVAALVYNIQTSGAITQQVKAAAVAAGVPVVPVTETLPAGTTYLSWMRQNVEHVAQATAER